MKKKKTRQQEVIVVGAGIAGLASAIRLKSKGYGVTVFEANSYFGGKLTAFTENGFRFDMGPSLFTMPHFIEDLFSTCGKDMKDYFLSEIYEFGDTETIFNIKLKKFVDRDSSDGVEAEEIQSDWGQRGKDFGFYNPNARSAGVIEVEDNEIKNKVLSIWQNRRYRQIWNDHKICITVIAVVVVAAIIL